MSDRIQELVVQAKQSVPAGLAPEQWLEVYHRTFAQLIIKETLQAARAGIEYGPSMEEAVYTYFGVDE